MEIKKENLKPNIEDTEVEDVMEKIEQEKEEFNKKEEERMLKKKPIRPGSIMYYKIMNYEKELVELEIKFPSTNDRFIFFNVEISQEQNTTLRLDQIMRLMISKKLIREKKTNKVIDIEDYPISEMIEVSGILFQLCN